MERLGQNNTLQVDYWKGGEKYDRRNRTGKYSEVKTLNKPWKR